MNAQEFTLFIQALAGGLLVLIPVYQKWKVVSRAEIVADIKAGIRNGAVGPTPLTSEEKKAVAKSVLLTWESWASMFLGAVLTISSFNSFYNARRAVSIIEFQRNELSSALETATNDRRLILENIKIISNKLDRLAPKSKEGSHE